MPPLEDEELENQDDDFDNEEEAEEEESSFAEQEFNNYCEANELDHDEAAMEEDERKDFLRIKRRFMKAVDDKRIVVDGEKLIYTISDRSPQDTRGTKITLRRPNGRAMLSMDGYKDTQQMNKLQAFMAAIAGIQKRDISKIASLDKKDLDIIQDIAILFLTA